MNDFNQPSSPAPNYCSAAQLADLADSCGLQSQVGGRPIALFKLDGEVFALDGICPHKGAPLGQGTVENGIVSCPLHGWQFDIKTGACLDRPDRPAACLPVRVVDGRVEVQL